MLPHWAFISAGMVQDRAQADMSLPTHDPTKVRLRRPSRTGSPPRRPRGATTRRSLRCEDWKSQVPVTTASWASVQQPEREPVCAKTIRNKSGAVRSGRDRRKSAILRECDDGRHARDHPAEHPVTKASSNSNSPYDAAPPPHSSRSHSRSAPQAKQGARSKWLREDPRDLDEVGPSPIATRGRTAGAPRRPSSTPSTRFMILRQAYLLVNAMLFARSTGRPLNAFITITWNQRPNFSQHDWVHHDGSLMKSMRAWLERRGVPPAYVLYRENVRGRGPHTHVYVHIPPARWGELKNALQERLLEAGEFRWPGTDKVRASAVLITGDRYKLPGTNKALRPPGANSNAQQRGLMLYALKTLDPRERLLIGDEHVSIGEFLRVRLDPHADVHRERVVVSQSINRSRWPAGWPEKITDILGLQRALSGEFDLPRGGARSVRSRPARPKQSE